MIIPELIKMSIQQRKDYLMKLADEMAAATTSKGPQGYESFLETRKRLHDTIDAIGNIAEDNLRTIAKVSRALDPTYM